MPDATDRRGRQTTGRELGTITKSKKIGAPGRTRTCDPLLRRQMLYPLSYGSFVVKTVRMLARLNLSLQHLRHKKKGCRNTLRQPLDLEKVIQLRRAGYLSGFGINTSSVKSIVDDFSDGRYVGVNIHSITRCEMANDPLSSNVQHCAAQFRKSARLDVIDSL